MKTNSSKNKVSRRAFLGTAATLAAGITIIPRHAVAGLGHIAPSDQIVMGFIGLGRQALSDFTSFKSVAGIQVAACCDVDSMKQLRFKRKVEEWQKESGVAQRCDMYEQYEELLERKDIDAVEVCTPDHWHALQTIHACQAQKDVYVQKPLAFTIKEGLTMVDVAKKNNRIVQVGSQQRSDSRFKKAIELVQAGAIGHIEKVYATVGTPPKPFNLPKQVVPANLNWNLWLGPLNNPNIHYNSDLCPPISINPEQREKLWGAWRWYRETGNGFTADWGAHMFDIAQAAIGMDGLGPAEIIPQGYKGQEYLTFKYLNGIEMTEQPYVEEKAGAKGIKFWGTNGWIDVSRTHISSSDPSLIPDELTGNKPGNSSKQKAKKKETKSNKPFEVSAPHMQNFIDSVRTRLKPAASIEVGCSTNTLCCLGNIATELARPVKWNPATLSFGADEEAAKHRLYHYEYNKPYQL